MLSMNDREIGRMEFRIGLMRRRGWPLQRAERFADVLLARDREHSDQRACIECAHLQRAGTCFAAQQGWIANADRRLEPVNDVLARCANFQWAKPA